MATVCSPCFNEEKARANAAEREIERLKAEPSQELLDKWFSNELHDFNMILDHLTRTYCHFSDGKISKPNTLPEEVFACAEEKYQRDLEEGVKDEVEAETEDLRARLDAATRAIREAPHDPGCGYVGGGFAVSSLAQLRRGPCNCWKAAALADEKEENRG